MPFQNIFSNTDRGDAGRSASSNLSKRWDKPDEADEKPVDLNPAVKDSLLRALDSQAYTEGINSYYLEKAAAAVRNLDWYQLPVALRAACANIYAQFYGGDRNTPEYAKYRRQVDPDYVAPFEAMNQDTAPEPISKPGNGNREKSISKQPISRAMPAGLFDE